MATVPYKFYLYDAGGRPGVDVLQGSNTPYGASETDFAGVVNAAKQNVQYGLNLYSNPGVNQQWVQQTWGSPQALQQQLQQLNNINTKNPSDADIKAVTGVSNFTLNGADPSIIKAVATGQPTTAGYLNAQGNFQTANPDQQAADTAAHEAAVKAGTEIKVPIGNGFGYMPANSPGAQLLNNNGGQMSAQANSTQPANLNAGAALQTSIARANGQPDPFISSTGSTTISGSSGTTGVTDPNDPASQLSGQWADLYKQLSQYLTKLQQNGQTVNPNVQITPDQIAAFTAQAQNEISPYYANQLKVARQSLLQSLGYSSAQIQQKEADLQKQYGDQLRTLAENSADQGFAQSGIRQRQEGDLAYNANLNINDARNSLYNSATDAASTFAQNYGTSNLPTVNISQAPTAIAGSPNFQTPNTSTRSLYNLSPDVYNGLTGSQTYQQNVDVNNRVSQLEQASNQAAVNNQARTLNL